MGGARGRALGPRGRGSAPSSGGRGCGPGPVSAASRRRPQRGNAARARRGLWGRRVPGPARPCPPPARHARLRLQVPGEAQAAAAVPTVREAHARACAGVYVWPPLLRHLPAGVSQVRPGVVGLGRRCRGSGQCMGTGSGRRHVAPLSARPPGDLRSAHHDVKGRQ